jgi:hypothetical protein
MRRAVVDELDVDLAAGPEQATRTIDGAAHFLPEETPGAVRRLIEDWPGVSAKSAPSADNSPVRAADPGRQPGTHRQRVTPGEWLAERLRAVTDRSHVQGPLDHIQAVQQKTYTKGVAEMMDPRDTAEQAERQARIQEDIRQLFARYRRTTQTETERPRRFTHSASIATDSRAGAPAPKREQLSSSG